MENTVQTEQFAMVKQLAKPGADILATLTPRRAHIQHMLFGLLGEAVEAMNYTDVTNLVEELGDYRFYQYGLYAELGLTTESVLTFYRNSHGFAGVNSDLFIQEHQRLSSEGDALKTLVTATNEVFDLGKKYVVYNKVSRFIDDTAPGSDADVLTPSVELMNAFAAVEITIGAILYEFDLTDDELLLANQNKLLKGKDARYKSGSYSDEQANARADKATEGEEHY